MLMLIQMLIPMLMGHSGLGDSGEDPGSGYYREASCPSRHAVLVVAVVVEVVAVVVAVVVEVEAVVQAPLNIPSNYSLTVIERVLTSTREQFSKNITFGQFWTFFLFLFFAQFLTVLPFGDSAPGVMLRLTQLIGDTGEKIWRALTLLCQRKYKI